jgi:hypothetical protein
MIYQNILDAMGHTPMVQLNKMVPANAARVLVKYEGLNVGGSIKTRVAYNMVKAAIADGKITKDSIIVEPTSGNQGIGLALIGAVLGYKVRIIMPDSVSMERQKLMRHYGAEVVLIHDAGNIGDAIENCLQTALQMQKDDPNVFVPQQFVNPANPMIHRHQTGLEILVMLTDIKDTLGNPWVNTGVVPVLLHIVQQFFAGGCPPAIQGNIAVQSPAMVHILYAAELVDLRHIGAVTKGVGREIQLQAVRIDAPTITQIILGALNVPQQRLCVGHVLVGFDPSGSGDFPAALFDASLDLGHQFRVIFLYNFINRGLGLRKTEIGVLVH